MALFICFILRVISDDCRGPYVMASQKCMALSHFQRAIYDDWRGPYVMASLPFLEILILLPEGHIWWLKEAICDGISPISLRFWLYFSQGHIWWLKGAICDGISPISFRFYFQRAIYDDWRRPYVMASLPFPLDFDFFFTGPYMMIEGGHMWWHLSHFL